MKVEDALVKIRTIEALFVVVAKRSLTENDSKVLRDVLEEYMEILKGMEIASSQRLMPDWVEEYGL